MEKLLKKFVGRFGVNKKVCAVCGDDLSEKPHFHIHGERFDVRVSRDGTVESTNKFMEHAWNMKNRERKKEVKDGV
jgi:hypothetical protein